MQGTSLNTAPAPKAVLSRITLPQSGGSSAAARLSVGFGALLLALVFAALGEGSAKAQDAGVTTPAVTFAQEDFTFSFYEGKGITKPLSTVVQREQFFNRARCQCGAPVTLIVKFSASGSTKAQTLLATKPTAGDSAVMVTLGQSCNQKGIPLGFDACKKNSANELPQKSLRVFRQEGLAIDEWTVTDYAQSYGASTGTATDAGADGTTCSRTTPLTQLVWVLMSTDSTGNFDQYPTFSLPIDLNPPPVPVPSAESPKEGNEALTLEWTALDSTSQSTLRGYQVLCARANQFQVFNDYTPAFISPATLQKDGVVCANPVALSEDQPLVDLNPLFVCSDLLPTSTNSYRVKILENDVTYSAMVVAIDKAGNASEVSTTNLRYGTPANSRDFFYQYKGRGEQEPEGQAEGGFCSVEPLSGTSWAYGGGVLTLFATLVLRQRRRRS